MLGLSIVNIASLACQYILLSDVQNGQENPDMSLIETSDMLRSTITVANLLLVILSIVFFIMWFRRAYYNLHLLPWNNARHTEGWAAGSWFVPIINLWWPYQIMMDIWNGTQNTLRERLGDPRPAAIVGWWWALHLITSFYDNIAARIGWNSDDVDSLITSTKMDIIGEVLSIPAILITIVMIQRTNVFERELLVHSETPDDSIFSDNYTPPIENLEPKI